MSVHHGKMFGISVWIKDPDSECPEVTGKSVVGDFLLFNVMEPIFAGYCWVVTFLNPEWEPTFPLLVGPKVEEDTR